MAVASIETIGAIETLHRDNAIETLEAVIEHRENPEWPAEDRPSLQCSGCSNSNWGGVCLCRSQS